MMPDDESGEEEIHHDTGVKHALQMAARMYGVSGPALLPTFLEDRIIEVHKLVDRAGGVLCSRQVIATIIMQWKKDR
jgi:hypothetical protein